MEVATPDEVNNGGGISQNKNFFDEILLWMEVREDQYKGGGNPEPRT